MSSSPLKCIASRGGDAKAIGQMNQRGQHGIGIAARGVQGVVGEKIGGTALLVEASEAVAIAGQGALLGGVGNARVEHLKRRVEEDDGGRVSVEQLAIGGLEKGSAAQGQDCGTRQAGEDVIEL